MPAGKWQSQVFSHGHAPLHFVLNGPKSHPPEHLCPQECHSPHHSDETCLLGPPCLLEANPSIPSPPDPPPDSITNVQCYCFWGCRGQRNGNLALPGPRTSLLLPSSSPERGASNPLPLSPSSQTPEQEPALCSAYIPDPGLRKAFCSFTSESLSGLYAAMGNRGTHGKWPEQHVANRKGRKCQLLSVAVIIAEGRLFAGTPAQEGQEEPAQWLLCLIESPRRSNTIQC